MAVDNRCFPLFWKNASRRLLPLLAGLFLAYTPCSALGLTPKAIIHGTTFVGSTQTFAGPVGVDFFGGIPFAQPPLGNLRFAPPVLKDNYGSALINTTQFGPPCAQLNRTDASEDCLTLNVFRPASVDIKTPLPVLVWIFGGGFAAGETSIYNASAIVAQSILRGTPVMYVSVNYRLGPFGFPQGHEAEQRGALNLGLKDQLLGLSWVKKHISAFGGDSEKVTVFGESAGAMSIANLYLNSDLKHLVRGAIMESGSAKSLPWFDASHRQVAWDTFLSKVPACSSTAKETSFACMRSVDTSSLVTAWEETVASFPELIIFVPVLDGPHGLIPDYPSNLLAKGKFAKIPFIAGTNLDEGTLFVSTAVSTEDQLRQALALVQEPFTTNIPAKFQQAVTKLLQLYPDNPALGSPYGTGNDTFGLSSQYKRVAAIVGDTTFQAPRKAWIQAASDAGVKAFGYHFTDQSAATGAVTGVSHGSEIPYVYGLAALASSDPAVRLLSSAMVDYWISFAVTLDPNDGKGIPKTSWPQYQKYREVLMQFDTKNFASNATFANFPVISDDFHAKQISYINSVARDLET